MLYVIVETEFQYIPPQVASINLNATTDNTALTLIEDQDLQELKIQTNAIHLQKSVWGLGYTVIGLDCSLFAIYKGIKHDKEIAKTENMQAVIKVAQDQQTKQFLVAKIQPIHFVTLQNEIDMLGYLNKLVFTPTNQMPVVMSHHSNSKNADRCTILMALEKGRDFYHYTYVQPLPLILLLDIARQSALILDDLQENKNILHNDIKLENFIYTCDGIVKLIDFAFAKHWNGQPIFAPRMGSPGYVPPEYKGKALVNFTKAAQMYAYGVTMMQLFGLGKIAHSNNIYELFVPFIRDKNSQQFTRNTRVQSTFTRHLIFDFLTSALEDDPNKRPSFSAAANFFEKLMSQLSKQEKIIKIGVVDFDDYISAEKNPAQYSALLNRLNNYDAVWFADTVMEDNKKADYALARLMLDKNQIRTVNTILHGPNNSLSKQELLYSLPDFFARKFPNFNCHVDWVRAQDAFVLRSHARVDVAKAFKQKFKPGRVLMRTGIFMHKPDESKPFSSSYSFKIRL